MIKVLVGNMFESHAKSLVNTVNTVGVMGKGIAREFSKRYPTMFEDYKQLCSMGKVNPGEPYHYKDMLGNSIINFPTKDHWRSPSRIQDIVKGLDIFLANYKNWGIESVAFPALGCGNGGLKWSQVGAVMYQKLSGLDIPVEIYAPHGTPSD
jgi:O-acetyl-ADP-ribose deacetylase (regulator of RNase III)